MILFRWHLVALGAALCTTPGCWHERVEAEAAASREQLRSAVNSAVVTARCEDGRELGPGCGYLLERLAQDSIRSRFRAQHCTSLSEEQCQIRYLRRTDALFRGRYYAASWGDVAASCDDTPDGCGTLRSYELVVMRSHNDHVLDVAAEHDAEIERARRETATELARRDGDLLGGVFAQAVDVLVPGSGCYTYPSLIDGVGTTICP